MDVFFTFVNQNGSMAKELPLFLFLVRCRYPLIILSGVCFKELSSL